MDESAIIAIDKEIEARQQDDPNDPAIRRLDTLRGTISQRINRRTNLPASDRVLDFGTAKNKIESHKYQNACDITEAIMGDLPKPEELDDLDLLDLIATINSIAELVGDSFNEALNTKQPWDIVRDDFTLHLGGQRTPFTSTITPIAKSVEPTGGNVEDQNKIVSKRYEADGVNGVTAMDRSNHKHGSNIATTELESGGELLFRGVRHGVYTTSKFDPDKLPPNKLNALKDELGLDRKAGKNEVTRAVEKRRAMEGVTLALQSNQDVLNKAVEAANNNGDPPTLDIVSINLQTGSDTFEDSNRISLEGGIINRQTEALLSIAKDGVVNVPVVDSNGTARVVQVKVNVVPVNFPVNPGGTRGAGSWRRDNSIRDALQTMTGSHVADVQLQERKRPHGSPRPGNEVSRRSHQVNRPRPEARRTERRRTRSIQRRRAEIRKPHDATIQHRTRWVQDVQPDDAPEWPRGCWIGTKEAAS